MFVSTWRLDGRKFYAFGPENEKLRSPNFSFNRESSYRNLLEDLSLSRPGRSVTDVIMSDKYAGLRPTSHQVHEHAELVDNAEASVGCGRQC